jgi:hypothetical protein
MAEAEMPTKTHGNSEPSCKQMLSSQNHIEISKIWNGSPYSQAGDRSDFLAANGARSPRGLSYSREIRIETFWQGGAHQRDDA